MRDMIDTRCSIGQLEKSCERMAAKLRDAGYRVDIDVHRSGAVAEYSDVSYVEVEVCHANHDLVCWRRFRANGYGNPVTFTEARRQFLQLVEAEK